MKKVVVVHAQDSERADGFLRKVEASIAATLVPGPLSTKMSGLVEALLGTLVVADGVEPVLDPIQEMQVLAGALRKHLNSNVDCVSRNVCYQTVIQALCEASGISLVFIHDCSYDEMIAAIDLLTADLAAGRARFVAEKAKHDAVNDGKSS